MKEIETVSYVSTVMSTTPVLHIESYRIQNIMNNNVLWMTWLDWVEDLTQSVWDVHMSL